SAGRLLVSLGALAGEPRRITPLGRRILELPVHPRLARLLLAASDCGRPADGAAVSALLSERDLRTRQSLSPAREKEMAPMTAASDILLRLDLLAEAESARFSPRLRDRGIDPVAARQVSQLRDELLRRGSTRRGRGPAVVTSGSPDEDDAILKW